MNQVFKNPEARANLPRHGFSMGQSKKVTASFGQLLPVYYDILNAGEKIRFSTRWFTRTQPLSTAAMVRVREHVEYFFVPFEQIYSLFGSFRYGINDVHTSFADPAQVRDRLPLIRWKDINAYIIDHVDEISGGLEWTGQSQDQQTFDNLWHGAYRLFDLLGYETGTFVGEMTSAMMQTARFCPYMLCAYQKIFNDVYRLDDFTSPVLKGYSLDSGYNVSDWVPDMSQFLSIRYRPMYKDYFTTSHPSPLVNGVSMLGQSDQSQILAKVNQWLSDSDFALTGTSPIQSNSAQFELGNIQSASGNYQFIDQSGQSFTQAAITAPQIRTLFAIEKLAEITGRAGKHYDAQTLAHFGFNVPQGISGEVFKLGGQSQTLQIGEVVGTATTENSVLGEIAGKAFSVTKDVEDNEFTAPSDGIFMAIYSAVPEVNYLSRFDKLNAKVDRQDFYFPEFDKLGMQPLFLYEYLGTILNGMAGITGWQYRYLESKCKYNTVTHAFDYNAPFSDWTVHLSYTDLGQNLSERVLYCNPRVLDSIFLVNYSAFADWRPTHNEMSVINNAYATDPLIIDFDFNVSKSSVMSPYGIPNL